MAVSGTVDGNALTLTGSSGNVVTVSLAGEMATVEDGATPVGDFQPVDEVDARALDARVRASINEDATSPTIFGGHLDDTLYAGPENITPSEFLFEFEANPEGRPDWFSYMYVVSGEGGNDTLSGGGEHRYTLQEVKATTR